MFIGEFLLCGMVRGFYLFDCFVYVFYAIFDIAVCMCYIFNGDRQRAHNSHNENSSLFNNSFYSNVKIEYFVKNF